MINTSSPWTILLLCGGQGDHLHGGGGDLVVEVILVLALENFADAILVVPEESLIEVVGLVTKGQILI